MTGFRPVTRKLREGADRSAVSCRVRDGRKIRKMMRLTELQTKKTCARAALVLSLAVIIIVVAGGGGVGRSAAALGNRHAAAGDAG